MDIANLTKDLVIGAIDIGTISSTVAFAFADRPETIYMKTWVADYVVEEIPICLLIKKDGKTLYSYGYTAEKEYIDLVRSKGASQFFCYRGLEGIYDIEEDREQPTTLIKDISGKQLPAVNVLSMMVKWLTDKALTEMTSVITNSEVAWILTLPAGSSPLFQTIMRDAAISAGIDEKKFTLITSTDAAALLFNNLPEGTSFSQYPKGKLAPGTHFLTVIAGDISVDTIAHRVESNGKISELSSLKKEEWGSKLVFDEFETLFKDIVGQDVYGKFKKEMEDEWLDLLRIFETKVRSQASCNDLRNNVTLRLPGGLFGVLHDTTGLTLQEAISKSRYCGKISATSDKLRISMDIFEGLFEKTLQKITTHIRSLMQTVEVKAILMIGKFADVQFFKTKIKSSFKDIIVVFPEEASKAVLKGAFIGANTNEVIKLLKGQKRPLLVTAIDIGTTYSGWCRSYLHEFKQNPTKSYAKVWKSDNAITEKTPTCVLIQDDGISVEAFGYDAVEKYGDLMRRGKGKEYFYFRNFKMTLHKSLGEKLDRHVEIQDEQGRSLPAINVFAASIKFLKDDSLKKSENELVGCLSEDEIQWVLTVPAIWTDGAKQFMREAAIKAGIKSRRLSLALEPEAASIYCRHIPVERKEIDKEDSVAKFQAGTQYMILDAGGGTVDVTVHEVLQDGTVKEIHAASGGGWGGTMVNKAFENLLEELIGKQIYEEFCREETEDHLDILADFEIKKRKVSPSENTAVRMRIPRSLTDIYRRKKGHLLEDDLKASSCSADVQLQRDKINFSADIIRSLFGNSVKQIVGHVRNLLKDSRIKAILMVGGYSDSPMLQDAIKREFPKLTIVIPPEAVSSIMRGAAIFGHIPRQITERVLKYTYGVSMMRKFREGTDPKNKRAVTDSGVMCKDVFDKHVEIGQSVKVGESQTERSYTPVNKTQQRIVFPVFGSKLKDPKYTDENCEFIGQLEVNLIDHDGDLERAVTVAFTFSDTEIVVEGKDAKKGKEANVVIDFLD